MNSIIIGLTGQSGAGKTTVCDKFKDNGFAIVNCDEVARECTKSGSECNKELSKVFPACFDEQLVIDRKAISQIIFSDKKMLKLFDSIVYPFITKEIKAQIERISSESKYIILDAPTLFEAGADKLCDLIICVIADYNIRLNRILKRDNIDKKLAEKRFSSQYDTEFFTQRCDYVIENNLSKDIACQKTEEIIKLIKGKFNG